MSKTKKTRKEKVDAEQRHHLYTLKNTNTPSSQPPNSINTTANHYHYIVKDLIKTAILTASIVIAQIILFLLLKKHILVLPKLNY